MSYQAFYTSQIPDPLTMRQRRVFVPLSEFQPMGHRLDGGNHSVNVYSLRGNVEFALKICNRESEAVEEYIKYDLLEVCGVRVPTERYIVYSIDNKGQKEFYIASRLVPGMTLGEWEVSQAAEEGDDRKRILSEIYEYLAAFLLVSDTAPLGRGRDETKGTTNIGFNGSEGAREQERKERARANSSAVLRRNIIICAGQDGKLHPVKIDPNGEFSFLSGNPIGYGQMHYFNSLYKLLTPANFSERINGAGAGLYSFFSNIPPEALRNSLSHIIDNLSEEHIRAITDFSRFLEPNILSDGQFKRMDGQLNSQETKHELFSRKSDLLYCINEAVRVFRGIGEQLERQLPVSEERSTPHP